MLRQQKIIERAIYNVVFQKIYVRTYRGEEVSE